jgi:hypothetical protein
MSPHEILDLPNVLIAYFCTNMDPSAGGLLPMRSLISALEYIRLLSQSNDSFRISAERQNALYPELQGIVALDVRVKLYTVCLYVLGLPKSVAARSPQ